MIVDHPGDHEGGPVSSEARWSIGVRSHELKSPWSSDSRQPYMEKEKKRVNTYGTGRGRNLKFLRMS